jgi:spore photoproduct lyase
MKTNKFIPKKVYFEKSCKNIPYIDKIIKNTSGVPYEWITDPKEIIEEIKSLQDPIGEGKKYLLVSNQKGEFVKPCPCTPHYLGCNYYIINLDLNCPLDCSYCILQMYLENPVITIHANKQDLWDQMDKFLIKRKNRVIRIGTGELGDSLALDHITENSVELIDYFRRHKNVLFELKTKTTNLENVLLNEPAENIVIAWSLNSREMALKEEKNAPSISERLEAAALVVDKGFRTAFHFDPVLEYPGWEEGYLDVIDDLFELIDPGRISWISIGSLRFPIELKEIIKKRFPQSKIIYSEMVQGKDGKLRYFKPIRGNLYQKITNRLLMRDRKIPLYFCMESIDIWRSYLKKEPRSKVDVEKMLTSLLGSNHIDYIS